MAEKEIEVRNLKKIYPMGKETVHALRGVDLEIENGEFVSITGTSGSGKSTLLHIIGGIDAPTEGSVSLRGQDITAMKESELADLRRDNIGFVFQKFFLIQELNVWENILFPALLKDKNPDTEYIKSLCGRLGLSDRLSHMPFELSGGQQQRVAIARALVNKPKLILCDEPTGNLDKKTSDEVIGLLKELHAELKTTLLIVTHDSLIASQADRCIYIEDGVIKRG